MTQYLTVGLQFVDSLHILSVVTSDNFSVVESQTCTRCDVIHTKLNSSFRSIPSATLKSIHLMIQLMLRDYLNVVQTRGYELCRRAMYQKL